MRVRFYEPPRPLVPRAQIPSRLLAAIGGLLTLLMFFALIRVPGTPRVQPGLVLSVIIYGVYAADLALVKRAEAFADELYEFLKDVGQAALGGSGVEHALATVARRRGGPVAKVMESALHRAEDRSIDIALLDEAAQLGDETFEEAAQLLALVSQSEGPVGLAIRSLGQRLGEGRAAERKTQRILAGGIFMLTIFVVVAFPAAGAFISVTTETPVTTWGIRFYGLLAMGTGALQFTVFRSLRRALARQPAYMLTVYWVIMLVQYQTGVITWDQLGI